MSSDSHSSSRRILTRNKPSTHDDDFHSSSRYQSKSDQKYVSSSSSSSNQKQSQAKELKDTSMETSFNSSQQQAVALNNQMINYLNKEPFNEDLEPEESYLYQDNYSWKALVIDKLKNIIENLKKFQSSPIENKADIKENYKNAILLFSTMKKLNRTSQIRVNKARVRTHEEKNKIDEFHLELQNLLYEISHLKKEINTCLEFRSMHEDINLVTLEEFYAKAPIEVSNPEVTRINEHKLKLAQLDWELMERQNMLSRIKDLESQIDQREKQLKLKQSKLESLHPKLNQIIDACKPTLEYFNTNFDENCMFSEPVQYLPKPLFQFYMMMCSYRDTIDKDVKIEVNGDLDDAKRFNLNETLNLDDDEDSDSDQDPDLIDKDTYKKSKSKKSKSKKSKSNLNEKLFISYPLSCKVTFSVRGYGQFILEFFYLNHLKIVTVKSEIRLLKDIQFSDNPILRADSIFNCLYDNDNGLESPNMANKFLFNNVGIKSIEGYLKNVGSPFKWCQILCGLFYDNKSDRHALISVNNQIDLKQVDESMVENHKEEKKDASEDLEEENEQVSFDSGYLNETKTFELILNRLKSRFKARITLQEAINSLKNSCVPVNESFSVLRFKLKSEVASFKEITYDKFKSYDFTKHFWESSLSLNEDNYTYFELNLKNSSACLQAIIVIHQDYPRKTPLFAININWKYDRNFLNDEAIRDMEREINIYRDNYFQEELKGSRKSLSSLSKTALSDDKIYDIFSKQINHLLICFDVYLESEAFYLEDLEFQRLKLFPNSVRGRDRKRPYSYLASKDLFLQRIQLESN